MTGWNPIDSMKYIEEQGDKGRQRGIAGLLGQAYAQPEQRAGLLDKVATAGAPDVAMKAEQSFGKQADDRMERFVQKAGMAAMAWKAGNQQLAQSLYGSVVPDMPGLFPGFTPPPQMDDAAADAFAQIATMAKTGAAPAGVQEFQFMAQGLSPEDQLRARRVQLGLDPRQSSAAIQYKEIEGPDGRKYMVALDPRQVGAQTLGGGPTYGSYAQEAEPEPVMQYDPRIGANIDQTLPPNVIADILANPQAYEQGGVRQGPPLVQGDNPFASRPKEAETFAVETAKQSVKLGALPHEQAIKSQAEIAKLREKDRLKREGALASRQAEKDATLRVYEAAMQGLTSGLSGTETGPVVGRIPAVTSAQQTAEGGVAAMAPILKQLFRAAGEGTFTDKDQELLLKMVPTRTDTPEARKAKLRNIDNIVRAKLGAQKKAPASGGWGIQRVGD